MAKIPVVDDDARNLRLAVAALKRLRAESLAGFAQALLCARGPKLPRREFLRARGTFPISGVWRAK